MPYIHETAEWPQFTWDAQSLADALAAVRHRQGRLLGRMEGMGFELRSEASLVTLTGEIVKSSAIEGEVLRPLDAAAARPGLLVPDRLLKDLFVSLRRVDDGALLRMQHPVSKVDIGAHKAQ